MHRSRVCLLGLAVLLSLTAPVSARQGLPVRLADGDSFALGDERYRLYGIDAPELNQYCTDENGRAWPCGTRARSELRRLIGTSPVQCRTLSSDRYGRKIAVCHAGNRDLGEEMVRAGFATAFDRRGEGSPYRTAEAEARADKRGLWAGSFDNPVEWRRANPREPDLSPTLETAPDWLMRRSEELWRAFVAWIASVFRN